MGRPPLKLLRTHISISPDSMRRLDKLVGPKGRAAFIRDALDKALDTVELAQRLDAEQKKRGK